MRLVWCCCLLSWQGLADNAERRRKIAAEVAEAVPALPTALARLVASYVP
jgi:hypothetical protein